MIEADINFIAYAGDRWFIKQKIIFHRIRKKRGGEEEDLKRCEVKESVTKRLNIRR